MIQASINKYALLGSEGEDYNQIQDWDMTGEEEAQESRRPLPPTPPVEG